MNIPAVYLGSNLLLSAVLNKGNDVMTPSLSSKISVKSLALVLATGGSLDFDVLGTTFPMSFPPLPVRLKPPCFPLPGNMVIYLGTKE